MAGAVLADPVQLGSFSSEVNWTVVTPLQARVQMVEDVGFKEQARQALTFYSF